MTDAAKPSNAARPPDSAKPLLAGSAARAAASSGAPLLPGSTLGVLGGGQLGRMFVHQAQAMGYFTAVLDADPDSPAGLVSHHHVRTGYADPQGMAELARVADAVTTEFENVPAAALAALAAHRPVSPAAGAVSVAQDRAREKAHFVDCGVPCAPYGLLETAEHLAAVSQSLLPGILKTARMGYDGKGQVRVGTTAELAAAWESVGRVPCVLEKMLPLALECSVIVARGTDGTTVHLPVQRNLHRGGILAVTEVYEQNMPPALAVQASAAAISIANGLQYVGVLCVEFFVLEDGSLVVNEIAPRPHNSGHYSQNACDVSQFELQVRTLARLPLTQPRQHSPAVMLNLLGDLWFTHGGDTAQTPPWAEVLALPGTHLHLYGKRDAKRGRKMGHLNVTGPTPEAARATALQAAALLGERPVLMGTAGQDFSDYRAWLAARFPGGEAGMTAALPTALATGSTMERTATFAQRPASTGMGQLIVIGVRRPTLPGSACAHRGSGSTRPVLQRVAPGGCRWCRGRWDACGCGGRWDPRRSCRWGNLGRCGGGHLGWSRGWLRGLTADLGSAIELGSEGGYPVIAKRCAFVINAADADGAEHRGL